MERNERSERIEMSGGRKNFSEMNGLQIRMPVSGGDEPGVQGGSAPLDFGLSAKK